jgi:hypothetical protein
MEAFHGYGVGASHLVAISRAERQHVGHWAQRRKHLNLEKIKHNGLAAWMTRWSEKTNGLVRRAVFAQANAVVREYVDDTEVAQSRKTNSAKHVAAKVKKGGAEWQQPAVRRNTVANATQNIWLSQWEVTEKKGKK